MKRKLNGDDTPEEVKEISAEVNITFDSFGLENRVLSAVQHEKFSTPTPVQAQAIPLVLEGRDVLARATTGSGKTAAYVLPILSSILQRTPHMPKGRITAALILVPTRDLASQVIKMIAQFSKPFARSIQAINLAPQISDEAQRALLASVPDIVVATPARASTHLSTSTLVVDQLQHLVIDEADLIFSYGYESDMRNILSLIPKGVQTFLASATLNTEVDTLKTLFCRDPVVLDLQDGKEESAALSQYMVHCAEDEKFLLIFALFKLRLIRGKCIIFVGDIDRCYRLKLYLEQFGIKSCILNSELPVNSRVHVIEEYNRDVYDIIIATDEHESGAGDATSTTDKDTTEQIASETTEPVEDSLNESAAVKDAPTSAIRTPSAVKKRKQNIRKKDKEYGISRGIDFHNVACVLNFDLPTNAKSYTHCIGRTARANRTGIAISFVVPASKYHKHKPTSFPTCKHDETVLASIIADQEAQGRKVEPYRFDMDKLEGFRYRVASALKAVSSGAIKEARIRELRQELLKSERLKRHLEENPEDLKWLRHDTELRPAKVQPHLKHVPQYLMPKGAGGDDHSMDDVGFVGLQKSGPENRRKNVRMRNKLRARGKRLTGRKADPLKTFNAKGRK